MLPSPDPTAGRAEDPAPPASSPRQGEPHGSQPVPPTGPAGGPAHQRTGSAGSNLSRDQTPPPYAQHLRSDSNSSSSRSRCSSEAHATATQSLHRCSEPTDSTPPAIRYSQSETASGLRQGLFGGGFDSGPAAQGLSAGSADDPAKNNYALWLPWEEAALVDWLFAPKNRRLFNIPRRKKECHELIIKEILPGKTSRAIEGKIRTLEKRYLKVLSDVQDKNFAAKHPGKQPRDVAKALCASFDKLEAIFNPQLAQAQAQAQTHQPAAAQWAAGAPLPATTTTVTAHSVPPDGDPLSVPRRLTPPCILATESMPLLHRMPGSGRKIAPKRGLEGSAAGDMDTPPAINGGKRSRTLPAPIQSYQGPGLRLPQHYLHHVPPDQQSPPLLQHQQHQRIYEAGVRAPYEVVGRQAAAAPPMMPPKSPATAAPPVTLPQGAAVLHPHYPHQQQQHPQSATPSEGNAPGMRGPHEAAAAAAAAAASATSPGAVQGTREELEWLQFNLRREELEFRKAAFVREQDLEARRVRLEEQRLENQRRDAELEGERLAVSRRQMDLQVESLKALTTMLEHMVGHMATATATAAAAAAGSRPTGPIQLPPLAHAGPAPDDASAAGPALPRLPDGV
ncbi:hypothetical protein IWQ57_002431 [Coemansia nantahalensis]|uniref:Uncharacterized protein n=2 Tax=Coemansia TaxID=4863 RepID=A0ACC1LEN1_9FUNG|nr:hypothetical protein IWQ57_002431 [Coemansia nantahalensis]KAJ2806936.1 hypothetical protein H4R21_000672 [Coemansia helicoidea]